MSIVDLTVSKAKKLIAVVVNLDALHKLRTQEMANKNFSGGRKSVLQTLEEKRQELLKEWRSTQASTRVLPIAVVGNLIDDAGNRIPIGHVCLGLSKERLNFFVSIGGVVYRESSSESPS